MKKYFVRLLLVVSIFSFSACELDELLENPNGVPPEQADPDFIFNNIQLSLPGFFGGMSGYGMEVTRMRAMTGGNSYDNAYSPVSFNGVWSAGYAGLMTDLDALLETAEEKNLAWHAGAAKLIKAYVLMTMVDYFGDIPYSEYGQGLNNPSPMADDDEAVYNAAVALIDEAIADFGTVPAAQPATDLYYGELDDDGPVNWIKFANTLKLRYFNQTRLVNAGAAAGIDAILAEGNFITERSEDFQFQYGSNRANPNSRHPFYNNHYENGNGVYLSNYYMFQFAGAKGFDDPRLPFYFFRQDTDATDEDQFTLGCLTAPYPGHYDSNLHPFCVADVDRGYWGRDHGDDSGIPPDGEKRTVYGLYPGGGLYDDGSGGTTKNDGEDGALGAGIQPIMLSSFVDFIRAEAALTLNTLDDARAMLESAILKSMIKVSSFASLEGGDGVSIDQADVDAYILTVLTEYDAASNDGKLNIIMREYYLAAWGNGIEAYNGYRRTGKPENMQPTRLPASGNYYRTFLYPSNYVTLNANASQKENTVQVFWDNNPAGFIN